MQTLVKLLKAITITVGLSIGVWTIIYLLQLLYSIGLLEEVLVAFIIGLIFSSVWAIL